MKKRPDSMHGILMAISLLVVIGCSDQVHAQKTDGLSFDNLRIIDPKEARRNDPFAVIHDKPLSESATVIPQLIATANVMSPQFLYELARRLWPTDKDAAMEWIAVGMTRARFDALRCVYKTAPQGIMVLPMIAPDVIAGIEADRKAFGKAGLHALARQDIFVDTISPQWICMHGMSTIMAAMQGKRLSESDWLKPRSEWEAIREDVLKTQAKYFEEQGLPQDDPIPMTKMKFPQITLPPIFKGSYAWLDSQRLVAAINEKGGDGKPVTRLASFSADGKREDIATTSGIWCAGNGVISYQTAIEKLANNVQRITLDRGVPGKWSSLTLDLRYPYLNYFGAQGFSQSWSLPTNASRQSPFDCRWEMNEALSGDKNANQWIPLLPGDGAILFDKLRGNKNVRWVTAKGDEIRLPIEDNKISLQSFRYLVWKEAYFVAQTWSRFTQQDKTLPTCIPAVYIYPKQRRIEEVCAPLDSSNTNNAAMFSPSRPGWLRATTYRNTAHGVKTGGLYLIRPDGKSEKLVDTNIDTWDISPDGCKVAFAHRRSQGSPSDLDILDLCHKL